MYILVCQLLLTFIHNLTSVFTNWDFAAGFQYLSLVVDTTNVQAALVLISEMECIHAQNDVTGPGYQECPMTCLSC